MRVDWKRKRRAYLRRLDIDSLAYQWISAGLFPACAESLEEVAEEFQRRSLPLDKVVADYRRRLVAEERERRAANPTGWMFDN